MPVPELSSRSLMESALTKLYLRVYSARYNAEILKTFLLTQAAKGGDIKELANDYLSSVMPYEDKKEVTEKEAKILEEWSKQGPIEVRPLTNMFGAKGKS